jgi:hypothetical protein
MHRQPPRQPSLKATQSTCYKEGILFHVSFSHVLVPHFLIDSYSTKFYAWTFILFFFMLLLKLMRERERD